MLKKIIKKLFNYTFWEFIGTVQFTDAVSVNEFTIDGETSLTFLDKKLKVGEKGTMNVIRLPRNVIYYNHKSSMFLYGNHFISEKKYWKYTENPLPDEIVEWVRKLENNERYYYTKHKFLKNYENYEYKIIFPDFEISKRPLEVK